MCDANIGLLAWLPPYVVELRGFGQRLGDVAFGSGDEIVVSGRFLSAWREQELVGIRDFFPAKVGNVVPGRMRMIEQDYYVACVSKASTTRIDCRRSEIVRRGPITCSHCGGESIIDAILSLRLDESSWSGEDIFSPWGVNGIVIVTRRFVSMVNEREIVNATTLPIEAYRWDPLRKYGGSND